MSSASLNEIFWQTVVDTCGSTKIDPSCQLFLQAWISNGVQLMEDENRLKPEDIETAKNSLKTFVEIMKAEAMRASATRLDIKSFRAAEHVCQRKSMITVYSLWPFWPHTVTG
jgi:hypothetical protein